MRKSGGLAFFIGGKMKIAFISGPYRADTEWEVKKNIERAESYALKYWREGYAVICPHKNTAFMGGSLPDHFWLRGCQAFVSVSDLVVMIPGWEKSKGAKEELSLAAKMGKAIIYES